MLPFWPQKSWSKHTKFTNLITDKDMYYKYVTYNPSLAHVESMKFLYIICLLWL